MRRWTPPVLLAVSDGLGGELLCEEHRCPLCRLNANAAGLTAFSRIVQDSTMLRLPHPKPEYAGSKRLMLKDTISDEDR